MKKITRIFSAIVYVLIFVARGCPMEGQSAPPSYSVASGVNPQALVINLTAEPSGSEGTYTFYARAVYSQGFGPLSNPITVSNWGYGLAYSFQPVSGAIGYQCLAGPGSDAPPTILLNNEYEGNGICSITTLGGPPFVAQVPPIALSYKFVTANPTLPFASLTGTITDGGGQVYNVKAYGATGNGTTDDAAAVQDAINACEVSGGTVFLPAATYLIRSSLTMTSGNCSVRGAGQTATIITAGTGAFSGTALVSVDVGGFPASIESGPKISRIQFNCNGLANGQGTGRALIDGLNLIDSPMWNIRDSSFMNCENGIELNNSLFFTERDVIQATFENNANFILLNQTASDPVNSFEHCVFDVFGNTYLASDNVFATSGNAATFIGDSFIVNGNLQAGSSEFYLAGGPSIQSSHLTSLAENDGGSANIFNGVSVGTSNNACGSTSPCVVAYGYAASGTVFAGSTWSIKGFYSAGSAYYNMGSITTTASTSDTLSNSALVLNQSCFAFPTNAEAASMTGVWVSSVTFGTLTLSHPATAGGNFTVVCQFSD